MFIPVGKLICVYPNFWNGHHCSQLQNQFVVCFFLESSSIYHNKIDCVSSWISIILSYGSRGLINNFCSILQSVLRISTAQKTIPAAQLIKLSTATLPFHVARTLNVSWKLIWPFLAVGRQNIWSPLLQQQEWNQLRWKLMCQCKRTGKPGKWLGCLFPAGEWSW